jgi:plastocyanin
MSAGHFIYVLVRYFVLMGKVMNKRSICQRVALAVLLLPVGCSKEEKKEPAGKEPPSVQVETPLKEEGYQAVKVQDGGSISGKVIFKGKRTSSTLPVAKDREVCGESKQDPSLIANEKGEVQYAVVSIVDIRQGKEIEPVKAVLDQKGCEYHPHVLAIPAGTTIEILNSDGVLHNVHTISEKNKPFNRAQPKYLKTITHLFKEPEIVPVKCDVHGWMSAWIFVARHPYYSVTMADGAFSLKEVPPGSYTLEVWHETLGKQTQRVEVGPSGKVEVIFTYPTQ